MSVEVVVRLPGLNDAVGMARTHVSAWKVGYRALLSDDYLDGLDVHQRTAYWQGLLAEPIRACPSRGPVPLVADLGGAVVGITTYGPYRPELDEEPEHRPAAELWMLNVHPEYWGRGVAQAEARVACRRCIQSRRSGRNQDWRDSVFDRTMNVTRRFRR